MRVFMFNMGAMYTNYGQRIVAVQVDTHGLIQWEDLDRGISGIARVDTAIPTWHQVQRAVMLAYAGDNYHVGTDYEISRKLRSLGNITV